MESKHVSTLNRILKIKSVKEATCITFDVLILTHSMG